MKTLAFMASSSIALPTLDALHNSHYTLACLYTQPPKPSGRGLKLLPTPLHQYALSLGIPVFTPPHWRDPHTLQKFQELPIDCSLVFAYGHILPSSVLDFPPHGSLNLHASLLPALRGAAPINRAIEQGFPTTGLSLMRMEKKLDAGPILSQWELPLSPSVTTPELTLIIAELSAQHIVQALDDFFSQRLSPSPQDHNLATYAPKITKSEAPLNWHASALAIERKCRALLPSPACTFSLQNETIKLLAAKDISSSSPPHNLTPGTIINPKIFTLACGENSTLQLLSLQRPSKKSSHAKGFLSQFSPPPKKLS